MGYEPDNDELDELLRQVDALLGQPQDPEEDTQPDTGGAEPEVYRNFSNNYGRGEEAPKVRAYNSDFRRERQPERRPRKRQPEQKRKRRGCGCLSLLALLTAAAVVLAVLFIQMPQNGTDTLQRKADTATVLLCGVDEDGTRTDTVMLLYLSGSENRVGILSLPRDTYTVAASGRAAKLNSAYARNGKGAEGMEALLDYVRDIIGYRPDGYILVDFGLVSQVVDIMGGVYYDVPMDMEVSGVALEAGYQHISGKQIMTLLRFRKGYATADLGRVQVQRDVLAACLDQWTDAQHLACIGQVVTAVSEGSLTNLTAGNLAWVGKTLVAGMGDMHSHTLPGRAANRAGASYFVLDADGVLELINEYYNPYTAEITGDMVNIAG